MTTQLKSMLDPMSRAVSGGGLRKVRLFLMALAIFVVALVFIPSTATYVNPGHVGIVIHRVGGGVDPKPLGPGLHLRNPLLTQIEEYPTFMQTLVLTRNGL